MSIPSFVAKAVASGYTAMQIIGFLSNSVPNLSHGIKKARKSGYSPENIIDFLSKANIPEGKNSDYLSQGQRHANVEEKEGQFVKNIAKTAASIGTGYLASRAIPGLFGAASQAIRGNGPTAHNIGPSPMGGGPTGPIAVGGANIPTNVPGQVIQPQGSIQPLPSQPQQPLVPSNSIQILKQMGLDKTVDALTKAGNPPDIISKSIESTINAQQKKWLTDKQKTGEAKPIKEMVDDYLSQGEQIQQTDIPKQPEVISAKEFSIEPEPIQEEMKNAKKLEKGDVVISRDGSVKELESIRNKEALVKDDKGKITKVKTDEISQPDEDVIETVNRILKKPEIDKSSLISYWAYDTPSNELFVMYHNGESYKYIDVPKDLVNELSEGAVSPKTEGGNVFGVWSPEDEMSRGATLSDRIIRHEKYRKSKKGEPANPNYRRLMKGYDYWKELRRQGSRKKL